MSLLVENSTKISSNIEKLISKLYEVDLKIDEATNKSADIAPYKDMITNVIKRAKEKLDFNDFCYVLYATTPKGEIPYQGIKYIGRESDKATPSQMKVFIVPDVSAFPEGSDITTNGAGAGVGKVLHSETGKLLVQVTSGYFLNADSIDNANPYAAEKTTITEVYSANTTFSAFLENYVDVNSTADGEINSDLKEIVSIIKTLEIDCTTKELPSGYTIETLSDAISVYGINFKESLIDTLSNILIELEQSRIFNFMKNNAYQRPDIDLTTSYGVNSSISNVFKDLYARINQSAGAIRRNSKMSGEVSVVASSNIYRALLTANPNVAASKNSMLPSGIRIVEDPYTTSDYLCVALNPFIDRTNSAVIYTPYTYEVQNVVDPENFHENIDVMVRSDIVNNPLAQKENDQEKNEMMEVTYITGYETLKNTF